MHEQNKKALNTGYLNRKSPGIKPTYLYSFTMNNKSYIKNIT